jgi:hypothetical protein
MSNNQALILLPKPFTVAMIAIDMPAAIKPYSIALAPDSSRRNLEILTHIGLSLVLAESEYSTRREREFRAEVEWSTENNFVSSSRHVLKQVGERSGASRALRKRC